MKNARVRLHVDQPLGQGQAIAVDGGQAQYLFAVMRLGPGDVVRLFNGRDGEFAARVEARGKRRGVLVVEKRLRPPALPPDLWLVFAPVKKARTDMIVEKAVELGVRRIVPVRTEFTNSERFRRDKQVAHATEAAEQCGATHVPEVAEITPLPRLLDAWPEDRALIFADEAAAHATAHPPERATSLPPAPAAILIGPEGGFSAAERARLLELPMVHRIGLGPRILRAETAAIAALALWQAGPGDWT